MGLRIKLIAVASAAALTSICSAYAAQDMAARMAAVEECVDQAKARMPSNPSNPGDSMVMRGRTLVYSECMRKKGLRP